MPQLILLPEMRGNATVDIYMVHSGVKPRVISETCLGGGHHARMSFEYSYTYAVAANLGGTGKIVGTLVTSPIVDIATEIAQCMAILPIPLANPAFPGGMYVS